MSKGIEKYKARRTGATGAPEGNSEPANVSPAPAESTQEQPASHGEILAHLKSKVKELHFREMAGMEEKPDEKLLKKHYLVIAVEEILRLAKVHSWALCRNGDLLYLYNGAYWSQLTPDEVQAFLGEAAEKMGIDRFDAQHYEFREKLYKQFLSVAYLPMFAAARDTVLINLQNGTLEITPNGATLRDFRPGDFLTYQLPFAYDPNATAPMFDRYIVDVLTDEQKRRVLAEYLAYIFVKPSFLKLEKALILYGSGANGKSVLFEIVEALLGKGNVSNYSLQSLTDDKGYSRAKIVGKLVNYASEINASLEASLFKALTSGEPVEARLPYGQPFSATDYAKLIFNCNALPRDVEHSDAYFRRFLIIHFDKTIPEEKQDKSLARKIIDSELSGVLNWVLQGLDRILTQRNFSECLSSQHTVSRYRRESDSVCMFLEEKEYQPTTERGKWLRLPDMYRDYKNYCMEDGYKAVSKKTYKDRLTSLKFEIGRSGIDGIIVKAEVKRTRISDDANADEQPENQDKEDPLF